MKYTYCREASGIPDYCWNITQWKKGVDKVYGVDSNPDHTRGFPESKDQPDIFPQGIVRDPESFCERPNRLSSQCPCFLELDLVILDVFLERMLNNANAEQSKSSLPGLWVQETSGGRGKWDREGEVARKECVTKKVAAAGPWSFNLLRNSGSEYGCPMQGYPPILGQVCSPSNISQSSVDHHQGVQEVSFSTFMAEIEWIPASGESSGKRMQLLLGARLLISILVFYLKGIWAGHVQSLLPAGFRIKMKVSFVDFRALTGKRGHWKFWRWFIWISMALSTPKPQISLPTFNAWRHLVRGW